ncbi:hypothetical protein A8C75_13470 [Marinobacterium aestuarii]|uniref:Uncharacterized protein n=1 Tax=Marinobacterium aestuarii TaxID=1821621 RepID=A0A1A9F0H5_9GAMM|nr:hypothetical protein A8C75_13470 [Marinobacterium aestuarii]
MTSPWPPAAKGTMTLMGLAGKLSAQEDIGVNADKPRVMQASARDSCFIIVDLRVLLLERDLFARVLTWSYCTICACIIKMIKLLATISI